MSQMLIFFVFFTFIFDSCTNLWCFPLNFRQQHRGYFIFLCDFRRLAGKKEMQTMKFLAQFFVIFANFS
jgi:hypothetical protein